MGEIGRGGMGVVYKALDTKLKRTVALKVLIAGEDASEEAITRFHREAEAVAKLGHHPNIVPVHDIGAEGNRHYFAMHYVEGKPLDRMIDDDEITPKRAAEITRQIAEALAHAHANGIIHRDIKPANILMSPSTSASEPETGNSKIETSGWQPRVTDFGLAKDVQADSSLTGSGVTLGTPQYMPPEQADGRIEEISPLSDVYSLGCTLYEMLTRSPPFEGATVIEVLKQVLLDDPEPPRARNPAVPADLQTICLKCLEKDGADRYGSAGDLADDIGRFLVGDSILAKPAGSLGRIWRKAKQNRLAFAQAAVIFVALALFTVIYLRGQLLSLSPVMASPVMFFGFMCLFEAFVTFNLFRENATRIVKVPSGIAFVLCCAATAFLLVEIVGRPPIQAFFAGSILFMTLGFLAARAFRGDSTALRKRLYRIGMVVILCAIAGGTAYSFQKVFNTGYIEFDPAEYSGSTGLIKCPCEGPSRLILMEADAERSWETESKAGVFLLPPGKYLLVRFDIWGGEKTDEGWCMSHFFREKPEISVDPGVPVQLGIEGPISAVVGVSVKPGGKTLILDLNFASRNGKIFTVHWSKEGFIGFEIAGMGGKDGGWGPATPLKIQRELSRQDHFRLVEAEIPPAVKGIFRIRAVLRDCPLPIETPWAVLER
ncbi:MAG: bifunctional serine/threonine protein kinase/MFS transporter [Planctomycetota bacterium]